MQILINGTLTYVTKLALKRLIETGHDVHYSSDSASHTAAEPGKYDWTVAGVTAFSNHGSGSHPKPLAMALKQIAAMQLL